MKKTRKKQYQRYNTKDRIFERIEREIYCFQGSKHGECDEKARAT